MTIALDTNVLARAYLEDSPAETKIAKALMQRALERGKLVLPSLVIAEFMWVLREHDVPRAKMAEALAALLENPGIVILQREAVTEALHLFAKGKADFSDYMILCEARRAQAKTLATFDKTFCKDVGMCKHPVALV